MPQCANAHKILPNAGAKLLADHLLVLRIDLMRLLVAIGHPSVMPKDLDEDSRRTNLDQIILGARRAGCLAGEQPASADLTRRITGTANSIFSDRCLDVLSELDTAASDVLERLHWADDLQAHENNGADYDPDDVLDQLEMLPPAMLGLRDAITKVIQDFGLREAGADRCHIDQGERTTLLDRATDRLSAVACSSGGNNPAVVCKVVAELARFFETAQTFEAVAQLSRHFVRARFELFGIAEEDDDDGTLDDEEEDM